MTAEGTRVGLRLGDLLETTFRVWRRDAWLYCLVACVAIGIEHLALQIRPILLGFFASVALHLFFIPLLSGLLASFVSERLEGRDPSASRVLEALDRSGGALCRVAVGVALRVLVGFCALVIPGAVLSLRWMMAGPVIALEDTVDARGRSDALTDGHLGVLFGMDMVLAALFVGAGHLLRLVIPFFPGSVREVVMFSVQLVAICVAYHRLCKPRSAEVPRGAIPFA
jgi:hypothetical protein